MFWLRMVLLLLAREILACTAMAIAHFAWSLYTVVRNSSAVVGEIENDEWHVDEYGVEEDITAWCRGIQMRFRVYINQPLASSRPYQYLAIF